MLYIECPNKTDVDKPSLFLAGGLSGCRDWQKYIISNIHPLDIILYNPRREDFDIDNRDISTEQIIWEEEMIKKADILSFYFCRETVCPITLYELGVAVMMDKPLIVGMDVDYSRRFDVKMQVKLKRPEVEIVYGLDNLTNNIISLFKRGFNVAYGNPTHPRDPKNL